MRGVSVAPKTYLCALAMQVGLARTYIYCMIAIPEGVVKQKY